MTAPQDDAPDQLRDAVGRITRPFWFLRHGESVFNRVRRIQGQQDVCLSQRGYSQARRAAVLFQDSPITRIVSSPLRRAHDTALAVSIQTGIPVVIDPDLAECHLGMHQGEPYDDWIRDYWRGQYQPPEGEHFLTFRARVIKAIVAQATQEEPTLIVAHGGLWHAMASVVPIVPDIGIMPNAWPLHVQPALERWVADPLGDTDRIGEAGSGQVAN